MKGIIGKIKGLFPVTIANAVYVDGSSNTLADAMEAGELGNIGKSATIKDDIYVDYTHIPISGNRAMHDCTVIGTDIVSFNKYGGDDNGSICYTDMQTWTSAVMKYHNFVESNNVGLQMKSCDYKYGKLLVGNGRSGYDPAFGRMYVFYEADTWKTAEVGTSSNRITFENCGEYKEIDITALGSKSYAFWGNGEDIVFVSCNLFNDIYRIQLARGTTQWDGGTFTEETASDRYNGTWQILNHWHQDGALGSYAAHGGQYYNGHLYLATNDSSKCMVYKCILRNNGTLEFQPLNFDARKTNSTDLAYTYIDGMCIHDGKMYVQPIGGAYSGGDLVIDVPV